MSHRIAKITKAGVTCDCGVVTANRTEHRNHKTTGEVAAIVKSAAAKPAKAAKAAKPIMWKAHSKAEAIDISGLGLPEGSARFFADAAEDAGNWSGSPLIGGNIASGRSAGGWTAKLKAEGLVTTWQDDDQPSCYWLAFTEKGRKLAQDVLGFDPDPR